MWCDVVCFATMWCAGVHKYGTDDDKLCKRYLFNLEVVVKSKAAANKKIEVCPVTQVSKQPPRMLYLRELLGDLAASSGCGSFAQVLAVVRSSSANPTDARALLPTHLLPGATRHHGRRTIAYAQCTRARRPAPCPTQYEMHRHRAPSSLHGHRRQTVWPLPNSFALAHPLPGLSIPCAHRRDLKRCCLATNSC